MWSEYAVTLLNSKQKEFEQGPSGGKEKKMAVVKNVLPSLSHSHVERVS